MSKFYLNILLKLLSLGAIIAAAGLWAGAGVNSRPKRRDEQTLIGGTIWSQVIISFGLIISMNINENLDLFVHTYYLLSGVALCFLTGAVLLVQEYKTSKKFKKNAVTEQLITINNYDKIYLSIGILSTVAGLFTLIEFIVLIVL